MTPSPSSRLNAIRLLVSIVTCTLSATSGLGEARGEASHEQASYLGAAIEVRALTVDGSHRVEDARGLQLSFRYRVGRVASDKALHLIAHFETKAGRKVRALVDDKTYRDRDGFLHGKTQLLTVPRNLWKQGTLFIPFYAMDLASGHQELSVHFSALSDTGSCTSGRPPRSVKIIGQSHAPVALTKPPFKMVQLIVRHVIVPEEPTDVSFFRSRKGRPDLMWRLSLNAGQSSVLHSSKVRDDTYEARWTEYTAPFPFSKGDRLTLSVLDEDVARHDVLGSLKLSFEQIIDNERIDRWLKLGASSRIQLGQLKVR